MLTILPIPNDHFDSRAYLVWMAGRPEALVIDPADPESGSVARALEARGLTPEYILLTHEHFDHMAGVEPLRRRYGARLVCSRACSEAIGRPGQNFSRYLIGRDVACPAADLTCEDLSSAGFQPAIDGRQDACATWHGLRLEFIPTPGHSPGGICIAIAGIADGPVRNAHVLFTGDTLIHNVRTVTKLPGGDREQLRASVDYLLSGFPVETTVYPGHGKPFTLGQVDRDVIVGRLRA